MPQEVTRKRGKVLITSAVLLSAMLLLHGKAGLAQPYTLGPPNTLSGSPLITQTPTPLILNFVRSETFNTPFGPLTLQYEQIGNKAIMEDDILLNLDKLRQRAAQDMATYGQFSQGADGYGTSASGLAAVRNAEMLWPGAIVPFQIDPNLPNPTRVTDAIAHWEAVTPLRFVQRQNQQDFVAFVPDAERCASGIGRDGGRQEIVLKDTCNKGSIIHEIGHAIGLFHEQAREDRDNHVLIDWNNIQSGKGHNFNKYSEAVFLWFGAQDGQDLGPYDFTSIMHYGSFAFAADPTKPTITRRHGCSGTGCQISANRTALSTNDKRYVHELYCPMLSWNAARCANYLEPADGPHYRITTPGTSGCLDVANASMAAQAAVNRFPCHNNDNQLWQVQPDPDGTGTFFIRAVHSGQCLDVPGLSTGYVGIQQFSCNGGNNQKFRLYHNSGPLSDYADRRHGTFFLKPLHSNKCLGVDWQNRVSQTDCTSSTVALFQFEVREFPFDAYAIVSADTDGCMDVPNAAMGNSPVQTHACHGGNNQAWKFLPRASGAFAIQAKHSDQCLAMVNNAIEQRSCGTQDNPALNTSFYLHLMDDGTVEFRVGFPRRCVQVGSGALLTLASCNWADIQAWRLQPR